MNDNDLPSDELLQFVFGELNDARQAAVRKAVAEDAELAAIAQGLAAAVAAVRAENVGQVSDEFNDRLRRRMSEVFDPSQAETTRPTFLTRSLTTWRWIMRSPVSRVAAAAIFVLAVTGVALWFHAGGTTPAFADFIKPILEAKTVKYKMTAEMTSPPAGTKAPTCGNAEESNEGGSNDRGHDARTPIGYRRARRRRCRTSSKTVEIIWDGGQGKTSHAVTRGKAGHGLQFHQHAQGQEPQKDDVQRGSSLWPGFVRCCSMPGTNRTSNASRSARKRSTDAESLDSVLVAWRVAA